MKIWIAITVLALGMVVAAGCGGTAKNAGPIEVPIEVTGSGFVPARKVVKKGSPVVLVFTRKTNETCATDVVFASLHRGYDLPLNQPVRIELTAAEVGDTLFYSCSMNMIQGMVVAQ